MGFKPCPPVSLGSCIFFRDARSRPSQNDFENPPFEKSRNPSLLRETPGLKVSVAILAKRGGAGPCRSMLRRSSPSRKVSACCPAPWKTECAREERSFDSESSHIMGERRAIRSDSSQLAVHVRRSFLGWRMIRCGVVDATLRVDRLCAAPQPPNASTAIHSPSTRTAPIEA
jgi:hypothetical protein